MSSRHLHFVGKQNMSLFYFSLDELLNLFYVDPIENVNRDVLVALNLLTSRSALECV